MIQATQPHPNQLPPIYRLSQELIDEIIDAVSNSESSFTASGALMSCSLLSRAFQSRSQMHIFSRIRLSANNTRIGTLLQFIEKRPCIADYIQELCLVIAEGFSWLESVEIFKLMEKIVASNVPLRELALVGMDRMVQYIDRPGHLLDQIILPYIAATITTLQLEYVDNVPPRILSGCENLRTLIVDYAYFQDADTIRHPSPVLPRIRNLKFAGKHPELSTASSFVNCSDLRHLNIDWHPYFISNFTPIQEVINSTKGSLESVEVVLDDDSQDLTDLPSTFLNLANQPKLHTLKHHAIFSSFELDGLSDTCLTLQTISTSSNVSPSLSPLHLDFVLHVLFEPEVLHSAEWDPFVSEISRISTTRPLELSLRMCHWYLHDSADLDLSKEERKYLQARCRDVMAKVVEERLASFKNSVNIHLSQSFCLKRLS